MLHYDPPEDAKVYLHRSGRTARAGEDGLLVTLVLPEQEREVYQIEREAGTDYEIVSMDSDDRRLGDLANWEPPHGPPRDMGIGGSGGGSRPQPARRARGAAAGARNGGPNRSGDGRRSPGPWRRRENRRATSNG